MARNKFDIDESLDSSFNMGQAKRLVKYIKPYKLLMITTLLFMLVSSLLNMLSPYITRDAIDNRIPNKDFKGIVLLSALLLTIYVLNAIIVKFRIRAMTTVGQSVIATLRLDLFKHLQILPFSYYDSRPHGKILTRVINYVNSISDLLTNGIINLITDLFTLIVAFFFMIRLSPKLTLVCLCGIVVFTSVIIVLKDKQRKAWQVHSAKQSNLNAYIHESICGIKVTQSFSREWENRKVFCAQCENVLTAFMKAKIIDICNWPMVETISTLTTCAVFIIGAKDLLNGSITIGTIVAFTGYVSSFWNPILNLCNFYNQIMTAAAYVERIFETMDTEPNVIDAENAIPMPEIKGVVELENVTFSYEDNVVVLDNVSFKADVGETIAIVGPTGAGKTTIINLLSRFYNVDKGRVLIDGVDITNYTLHSLRKQVGVMLQDTFIFSGTIMDNIRYARPDATDEEVVKAAKTVCAHDFIQTLSNGYFTEVNERGSRLSAGQRQLISFARALLADPKILILDEATASIDTRTEQALQKGLNELLKNRTAFVIAHRLSTIKNATRIMYISDHQIKESGTHEELMAKKGYYYTLYNAQYNFLNE